MFKSSAAVLFAVLAAAIPASAQQRVDPNCSDDRGVDRCSEDQQRRTRALYGVRSIEEHRAGGDQVRRIFYVDGYGRDVVLVAFVRAPGRDPSVEIHFPQREGEVRPAPLQAPVPQPVWNDVIERSAHFDRRFVALPEQRERPGEERAIVMCIHSWVYTIEAVDRAAGSQRPPIRRKTEDACEDGPGEVYAQQLDGLARSLIPHCAALEIEQYRNAATALSACRILHGDRLASAEALNQADPFTNVEGPDDARLIAGLFDDEAVIDWAGERHSGFDANAFWAARMRSDRGRTSLFIHSVEGVNADRVRLVGSLSRPAATTHAQGGYEIAAVEQIWTRVNGGDLLIEQATVGPWQREPAD